MSKIIDQEFIGFLDMLENNLFFFDKRTNYFLTNKKLIISKLFLW